MSKKSTRRPNENYVFWNSQNSNWFMHCQNVPTALQCIKRRSLFSEIAHGRTGTYGSQAVSSSHRTTATCYKFGIYQSGHGKTTHGIFHMVHRPDRCNLVVRIRTHTAWASSGRKAARLERPVRHSPSHRQLKLPCLKKSALTIRVKGRSNSDLRIMFHTHADTHCHLHNELTKHT